MTKKYTSTKSVILIILILAAFIGSLWFACSRYLTLSQAKEFYLNTKTFAEQNIFFTVIMIVCAQAISMALSLPTKAIITMLSGALLGTLWGIISTLIGVLTGTTILFFFIRKLFRESSTKKFKSQAKLIDQRISRHPVLAIASLRLIITLPYGPITIASALTKINYTNFITGSILGDLPIVFLYVLAGNNIISLSTPQDAVSAIEVIILIIAGVVLFAGAIFKSKTKNKQHIL